MWQEFWHKFERSRRQGISSWAWPLSVLIVGLGMYVIIRVLIWLSQFTIPSGLASLIQMRT
ncbi:hypothetical protein A6M23_16490 [Acidithiobacillus thiooxidans]|jgi:hypothetical protein|uniref:Uncharacterized protein n=1 Tax=Acidithiobacillus thiooxidans TaxID=930 RepID=A0A1C2IZL0_ACITH|nr:hypothetical protein A6M23_16490 [Acidithiobacillus thiooxidans]OCX81475.1 hypothetical protein A6P08_13585 [Acidithiobacillus thiooxidans]